ncbi:MAG: hypothetical protein KF718_06970 [Polyangiaceae bacterium]|nr:hypothetical protein [Polyangiaceae bacterium]
MPHFVRRRLAALLPLGLSLTGCPERSAAPSGEETAQCSKLGQKCRLAPGVLGVCNDVPCVGQRQPPCLACLSQH